MDIIELVKREWAVISSAPFTILTIAALIWGAVWLLYRDRLNSAKELLGLKKEQLAEIQEKTGAQTPEEVLDRIRAIEDKLGEFTSADSIDSFVDAFNKALEGDNKQFSDD